MTDYYCDPQLGTGSNDGTTQANAWQSIQEAIDGVNGTIPTAGDTVYCRAQDGSTTDDAPSATIDFDQAGGSSTASLSFIGVNSSWTDDGTRCVIDGGSLASNNELVKLDQTTNRNFLYFKNFVFRGATGTSGGHGFKVKDTTQTGHLYFENNLFQDNGDDGIELYRAQFTQFFRCVFDNNGVNGIGRAAYAGSIICELCSFLDNGSHGVDFHSQAEMGALKGCIFDNNASYGIYCPIVAGSLHVTNSVFTRNNSGIYISNAGAQARIQGNRFAHNSTYGIQRFTEEKVSVREDYNVFYDNTSGHRLNVATGANSQTAANATELGFTDHASATWNRDFNLTTSAILRSSGIVVPVS